MLDVVAGTGFSTPRLATLARRAALHEAIAHEDPQAAPGCELCAQAIGERHRHLLDLEKRKLMCVCRPCSILFDQRAAGGNHYRLVPEDVTLLHDFRLDDALWAALRIPVDMAFFFYSSAARRVVAFYPSPMGATESLLELIDWQALVAANPILGELEPDVETLLIDRSRGRRQYWRAPVDVCYELVGLIRTNWKGLAGGSDVWQRLDEFFSDLRRRAGAARTTLQQQRS